MSAVLGIDAAWTAKNASGVALVEQCNGKWSCRAVSSSYQGFYKLAGDNEPSDGLPNPKRLIKAAKDILGNGTLDVIAVDMPLSYKEITGRRESDNQISRKFGGQACSTHTASIDRPGNIGKKMSDGFANTGYRLRTTEDWIETEKRQLIEVYPHPALLNLLEAAYRIPYKVSKNRRYWPTETKEQRKRNLLHEYERIFTALKKEIYHIELSLPSEDEIESFSFTGLKPIEDEIDALVCAWIGIRHIQGKTKAYGDKDAVIWVPFS